MVAISAVGVFFMGSGVSVMHGVHNIMHPAALEQYMGRTRRPPPGNQAAIDSYSGSMLAAEALKGSCGRTRGRKG